MLRRLAALLVLGVLTAPAFACAVAVYDQPRGDYHRWNSGEERAYRAYLLEVHRPYVEFKVLDRGEQERYWEWRHAHPDRRDRR